MSSNDRFSPPGKVNSGDIYGILRDLNEPVLSTTEISNQIDWASRSTVRRQLTDMEDAGELRSKKAGEGENAGQVWYPPDELPDVPQPTPDPVILIYRYPEFSMMVGGLLSIGIGFLFFIPGLFGQGQFLGLIERDWLIFISLVMAGIGLVMAYAGGGVYLGKTLVAIIQDRRS